MQSVRCTEMPICSCVRNRDAPSSPRTTLLTAARAYVVLHLCIPARYVAAPKTGVWCGYIKSGCGSIRYAPALRLLANGSSDRRWFATHTRHSTSSSNSNSSTVNPSARCCCYCCCCPAPACRIRSLCRGAGHLSVASSFNNILVTATRKPDETLKTPMPWMTVQRMEAMRPAAQRPRQ